MNRNHRQVAEVAAAEKITPFLKYMSYENTDISIDLYCSLESEDAAAEDALQMRNRIGTRHPQQRRKRRRKRHQQKRQLCRRKQPVVLQTYASITESW